MKVVFLAKSYPIVGGVEQWLFQLYMGLTRYDIIPLVYLARGDRFHDPDKYAQFYTGLRHGEIDGRGGTPRSRQESIISILNKERPQVIVPVLMADALVAAAKYAAKNRSSSVVYPIHEGSKGVLEDLRLFGNYLDRIVSVNPLLAAYAVKENYICEERVDVVPNGVELPVRSQEADGKGITRLGYCGRLEQPAKRVLDLVSICEALDQRAVPYHLTIAGTGNDECELRRRMTRHEAEGKVKFLGKLPLAGIYDRLYPNIDILLITSDREMSPLSVREAMIHGVVPVSSRFGGHEIDGILRDRENSLLFNVGDANGAAALIEKACARGGALDALSRSAKQTATSQCSMDRMLQSWASILHDSTIKRKKISDCRVFSKVPRIGRLEKIGISPAISCSIRRKFHRVRMPEWPGEEWPVYHSSSVEDHEFVRKLQQVEDEFRIKSATVTPGMI